MNAGFMGKTLSNATLCLKIKIVSKHIVDTKILHISSSKLCVTMRTFLYFGICKERTAFVLVSRQVGLYVMPGLMSDSRVLMVPPIARILTVYQVLQGRRCYPYNINIKCNLLFSKHIKRVKRKGHMRKKKERFIENSSLKTNLFLDAINSGHSVFL